MATEKNISSRIINKHDTEANWNKATNFIPKAGEIIIYDKDDNFNYSRIKIGDGVTNINSLAFQEQSTAIIDVVTLPTEDIDEDVLYRLVSGMIVEDSGDTVPEWSVIVVDGLPEIGEPVTNDMGNIIAYLNAQDNEGYGYIDANLEATTGVPIGWYGLGELAPSFGVEYGGTIFDIPQTNDDSITFSLLVEYALY